MAKTRKILDICEHGKHFICIKDVSTNRNPYKFYETWWNAGWHRKLLARYQDFDSVLMHILQEYGYRNVIL